jgi:DNA mismatch repair protein MutS
MPPTFKGLPVSEDETPMMRQYFGIKQNHPDSILFFRMGDFYEMFHDDAVVASEILDIALTSRNKNKANAIPMCGIPYHSINQYIAKLIKSGKKIALCEQVEDPKTSKGLVKREVTKIITPGTVLDDSLLDPKSNHFIVSLFFDPKGVVGLSALDHSAGIFKVTEINPKNSFSLLYDELEKLEPKEILLPESFLDSESKPDWLTDLPCRLQPADDRNFSERQARKTLQDHFETSSLEGFGCEQLNGAISSAGALLQYVKETQGSELAHINALSTYNPHNYIALDQATIRSLELVQNSDGKRSGTLLNLLDTTKTPMGARKLKEWILKPLLDSRQINQRLSVVDELRKQVILKDDLRIELKRIFDLERLAAKISLAACGARDLVNLKSSLEVLPKVQEIIGKLPTEIVSQILENWDNIDDVRQWINYNISDDPPLNLKDGYAIKKGVDPELDRLRGLAREGKSWIASLETKEKERTGISSLKIGYNKIYGYYIEVTKRHVDQVPEEYIRKQSLVNAERYICPELKKYEEDISGAEEKIHELELKLFRELREKVAAENLRIQKIAAKISEIDVLSAFAETARQNNYCMPKVNDDSILNVENGRHPLVEQMGPKNQFIPNDIFLDCDDNQIMIVTGPNMAGKSTYLRQVALIVLMSQIGSFVPSDSAEVGAVDRIFSRVGAHDNLLKGQSTFMVEMNETANILNNATSKSLVILDEVGRGTSTFDGISIAWSLVEYLHGPENIGAKTIFATHYHELVDLAALLPGVNNFNVQVKEWNDEIIFLRKIAAGGADKSYGIQVARLAGLPDKLLQRAREVLSNLEKNEFNEVGWPKIGESTDLPQQEISRQLNLFSSPPNPINLRMKEVDPNDLTPKQALDLIFEFRKLLEGMDE